MSSSASRSLSGYPPASPRFTGESSPFLLEDEFDGDIFPLEALPPMPKPQKSILRNQALRGVGTVGWAIAASELSVHAFQYLSDAKPAWLWTALTTSIHVQAIVAILAHAGLLLGDPGVITRSHETCLPLPPPIASRLRAGDSLDDLKDNIRANEDDETTYCVRCCLWRAPPPPPASRAAGPCLQWLWQEHPVLARCLPCAGGTKAHHCSLCQRCVRGFDHHCGVLGRCIAAANMPYFVVLVGMGQTAFGTNAVALLGLVYARYGYGALQTALLAFVAYAGLVLALLCLHQAGPLLRAARALCARLPPRLAGLRG